MQFSVVLLSTFALTVLAVNKSESYAPISAASLPRRQLMSCNQTYGTGFESCGGPDSTFCYNASAGQSCCPDKGYCEEGTYCAPVPGYCCDENEDLPTCARVAGFTLPASLATATPTIVMNTNMGNMTDAVSTSSIDATLLPPSTTTVPSTTSLKTDGSSLPTVDSDPISQIVTTDCVSTQPTVDAFETTSAASEAANSTGTSTVTPFVQVAGAAERRAFALRSMAVVGMTVILVAGW
ncbi:hypothetical protein G7054_g8838 [Neopestalotiopsis clavispora]|nr:hypothetical protein G7054_g8838 [Neopestalotiopsis clavispora]